MPLAEARQGGWRCAPTCSRAKRCPGRHIEGTPPWQYYVGSPTTHVAVYQYVTGRAGRVSWRQTALCASCAEAWAAKHPAAAMPPSPTPLSVAP